VHGHPTLESFGSEIVGGQRGYVPGEIRQQPQFRGESLALGPAQLGEALCDLATVRERAAKRREGSGEPLRALSDVTLFDQGELGQRARDGALQLVCGESQDLEVVRESLLGALPAFLEGRRLGVDLAAQASWIMGSGLESVLWPWLNYSFEA
jgi:hypothetical protein